MQLPKCEVCGKPANHTMRDVFVNDNWVTGVRELSPVPGLHHYCDEHNRESEMIDITESPLAHFHRKNNNTK